jgi:hypothetical protein
MQRVGSSHYLNDKALVWSSGKKKYNLYIITKINFKH